MAQVIPSPLDPLQFRRGRPMKNRFMLAPLTNQQSHPDGVLSDDEHHWLMMRATGGFGAVMTAAAHVHPLGQGFPGQLGVFADEHIPNLTKLAADIIATGALALVQLHHAGERSPAELIGEAPLSPSGGDHGARAMTLDEVSGTRDDFIAAAVRCQQAGFDGIELHGAHGYLLAQFISPTINRRTDAYGGSFENRIRLLMEIIEGVRTACGDDFIVGVRISPERFGMVLDEGVELARRLLIDPRIDFLDVSFWDTFKIPAEASGDDAPLLISYFNGLPRDGVALGVAGRLDQPGDVERALGLGADFVLLGRAAIMNHDFPHRYAADPTFVAATGPMPRDYLAAQGVSASFIDYLDDRFQLVAK